MAEGASEVSTSTRWRSAVSWEDFQTSSACCSGESSSPNAAWIPPCALAELQDWSAPFVASPTRAPLRAAETAAASPEAPLPITSTSNERSATTHRCYHGKANVPDYCCLFKSPDRSKQRFDLGRRRGTRVRLVSRALCGCLGDRRQLALRHSEVTEPLEAAETGALRRA